MSRTHEQLALAVVAEARRRVAHSHVRIRHCVEQLSDEQCWWRADESLNSVANLILHLCGNLRQWLINGLSGQPDARDRPGEFSDRSDLPRAKLLATFSSTIDEVDRTLAELTADDLLAEQRIQGFELTALGAIFDAVPHLSGHTQEIIYITRLQLGKNYRFAWEPSTPEEGAPG